MKSTTQLDDDNVYDVVPGDLLQANDFFCWGVAGIGDYDGDGEVAVGEPRADGVGDWDGDGAPELDNAGQVTSPIPSRRTCSERSGRGV